MYLLEHVVDQEEFYTIYHWNILHSTWGENLKGLYIAESSFKGKE
jgi:hypothetical protein